MTAAKTYNPSVEDALIRILLNHQELRSLENRKRLVLSTWRLYSPRFNAACNKDPALVEEILQLCPDSDSILRSMRDLQNSDGRFVDPERATSNEIDKASSKHLDEFT